jgi:hypothetical protein
MSDTSAPFTRLGEDAEQAPRLNYSIPEPTSHFGKSAISVGIGEELLNPAN